MSSNDRWLLPEGIEEILPEEASRLEGARRCLLDLYRSWGYELVVPPLIEYLESLLTGTGPDLDLQTFKLTDQLSGRLMGVRADMTPQVARIDAHRLRRDAPTRLCYIDTVLKSRSDGFGGSRCPLQVGAELYGHGGLDSEAEILHLMLETCARFAIGPLHLDLGHIGIFRALTARAALDGETEERLFDMLQRKAEPEIASLLDGLDLSAESRHALGALAHLHGGAAVFAEARKVLHGIGTEVVAALDTLDTLATLVREAFPAIEINIDLAELRGYDYENGVVFALYVPGQGQEIARGGRYDGLGKDFGRDRAAVGFSADLGTLLRLAPDAFVTTPRRIFAPANADPAMVRALRVNGEIVLRALAGQQADARALGCDFQLVQRNAEWNVETL
ncbi:MAG: ATP phosphoribosyltransferase regulatory subunit [Thiotrichales bacterium]